MTIVPLTLGESADLLRIWASHTCPLDDGRGTCTNQAHNISTSEAKVLALAALAAVKEKDRE